MVELIVGAKGKGKTKVLLEKAAEAVRTANGTVVYADKNKQHMYELSTKIRLIDITQYSVHGAEGFLGFVSGVIASDHDLECLILDSFITVAGLEGKDIVPVLDEIRELSDKYGVRIVISISRDEQELPEAVRGMVTVSL